MVSTYLPTCAFMPAEAGCLWCLVPSPLLAMLSSLLFVRMQVLLGSSSVVVVFLSDGNGWRSCRMRRYRFARFVALQESSATKD
ncbi:hypothetical protein AN467_30045 [Pseudomonas aeruginosa]|nr:hypothetical protein AN467_30045 [Pseudomonas aeruginosa]RPX07617.1 hypothetical protein IPC730_10400 [Pseudomonas aeruginosa]RPX50050.1 hypothetical protein IPC713_08385 [Pseudomonas aeruginosa]